MSATARKVLPFKPKPEQDAKGRFTPGNSGGARPIGGRTKLSDAFCQALLDDFEEHGAAAIVALRELDPATYVRVIASMVPKHVKAEVSPLHGMSDDELSALIRAICVSEDECR